MHRICHEGLTAVKSKNLDELEHAIKRYYTDRRKAKTVVLGTLTQVENSQCKLVANKTTFFSQCEPKSQPSLVCLPTKTERGEKSSKQTLSEEPRTGYKPPYAVVEYRGYYSTAPVLNFFCVEQENIDTSNEPWHFANCRLYLEIL